MYSEKPKVNDLHSDGLNILEDVIDDIPNKDEISINKPKDPHSDGLDEPALSGDEIDDKELEKILVHDNCKYAKKRKLGKEIYEIINTHQVDQDSLRPEYKEALDLYMKTSVKSFLENIEFKPWQISLLEEVKIPTERK